MKIHILGVCGTFMAGVAILAKQAGHEVVGYDSNVYPPMSTQLAQQGISLVEDADFMQHIEDAELVVIGNAKTRGDALVEYVLNKRLPFMSGPEWLAKHVLKGKKVLAVAGTHGKTSTSSMLAWILKSAGLKPGFLIGGIAPDLEVSACLGQSDYFVVEADEYDSAFFDKRSKFIHYLPTILILNNLEFDHADIFDSLDDIKKQFHHLVRTVASEGKIISPLNDSNIQSVLAQGCWSLQETLGQNADWHVELIKDDGSIFKVYRKDELCGTIDWKLLGSHNIENAMAALAAAISVGVDAAQAIVALNKFQGIKRRLELIDSVNDIAVYDDFAHHPTAIASTISGLRKKVGKAAIYVAMELASYTMRSDYHQATLAQAFDEADGVLLWQSGVNSLDLEAIANERIQIFDSVDEIVTCLKTQVGPGDHIVIMSNRGFDNIYQKLPKTLREGK